jgi:iron-sulfur cluster assembly protein
MITLTDKAVNEVKRIIEEINNDQKYLRVAVKGGGCSGFSYSLALDETYNDKKDTLIEQDGVQIVIDNRSQMYLSGSTIDYHDELMKKGFVFTNPNATGKCGCGNSFSV